MTPLKMEITKLSNAERKKGQKYALLANTFTPIGTYVITGALMIIFAGDVLNLPASKISSNFVYSFRWY